MASVKSANGYIKDKLEARDDLKEDGFLIEVEHHTASGDTHNPTLTSTITEHYCIPIKLTINDVWGNVRSNDKDFILDAINPIYHDDIIILNGDRMSIIRLDTVKLDNTTPVIYEVICR